MESVFLLISLLSIGACIGAGLFALSQKLRLTSFELMAKNLLDKAQTKAKELERVAEVNAHETEQKVALHKQKVEQELHHLEEKLERKQQEIDKREKQLKAKEESFEKRHDIKEKELQRIAQLSQEDARQEIYQALEKESNLLFLNKLQEIEAKVDHEAKRLIHTALSRLTDKQTIEGNITTVSIEAEEIKAKLIGREGRNIRTFEQATGVTLMIDDTPGVLVLSSFDPVRRHIAKHALQELITDSRIHPARIEEVVKKIEHSFENELIKIGETAAHRADVHGLHPEILRLLGRLHFRSSLGQNVLDHSVEVSHLMGIIAAELTLNESKARRIGLLHDIGKAIPAERGLSHAIAGQLFALKYGEKEEVANGIGCHHDEIAPTSMEAALCKPCDSISATRPGARTDNIEKHMRRLENLERIAKELPEVEAAYALQAGRELRVFVRPESVNDNEAAGLARLLAKKIEESHAYSGKIQVTVIREKKIIDFASPYQAK
ncbi:MAG: 2,3-cyclic-nucleotide 2-phosphodiesterase [Chlamydiia bacterium]|nr:2,3-cyclic-nucleotide 2-phosphodiesterase [Chlamydiia bacterium]